MRTHNAIVMFVVLLLGVSSPALGSAVHSDRHPLRPPDTSSPRDTLENLLVNVEEAYAASRTDRMDDARGSMQRAQRCLDLDGVPPRLRETFGMETTLRLKEIFDRIDLPAPAQVPGDEDAKRRDLTRWTVPNTEITITKMTDGPRQGEFLFNAATVKQVKGFYERVRHLPYKPEIDRDIDLYEAYILTPGQGIDPGWTHVFPEWAGVVLFEQAVWQWLSMILVLFFTALLSMAIHGWGRRLDHRREPTAVFRVGRIVALSFTLLALALADATVDLYINITGDVLRLTKDAFIVTAYALVGWLVVLIVNQIPEGIISSRHLIPRGVDSQLMRLGFRLLSFTMLAALVIQGAAELGFPAYSVITGLGVGGLAVALAARDTLANFLGSIIIMWDRPYQIGDWIVVGDKEGMVEDIGFRSTRIRSFYDSQLSIPNSDTVNATVDNMGRRKYRRIRTFVSVTYDTPAEKIEAFLEGIKNIIRANPTTRKDYFNVVLHDFGSHSLDIMLYFFVRVADYANELVERQRVLLEVIRLAEAMEIRLAFPTQTVQVESFPGQPSTARSEALAGEELRTIAQDFGPEGERARPKGSGLFTAPQEGGKAKDS